MKIRGSSLILILLFFFSCKKDEDEFKNNAPVADFKVVEYIDHYKLYATASDPEMDSLSYSWTANTDLVALSGSRSKNALFYFPTNSSAFDINIELEVDDGYLTTIVDKVISVPEMTNIRLWGLGKLLETGKANNVYYNWYLDQMNTGPSSSVNCGPTSVTMAVKWANENFTHTPEEARNTFPQGGGWWYTYDIINYLNKYTISNTTIHIDDIELLKSRIDAGKIIILCLDMFYIPGETDPDWRINRFYTVNKVGWGHFIVVKGYKIVDSDLWFEVYDPNSFGKIYPDNSLKGKDRYYLGDDIDNATNNWWDYAIVVSKGTVAEAFKDTNTKDIPHMPGR